ncbi:MULTISPECIES: hypothetical protein [Xanthomonas]|uniref:Uncharacterized protein n=1 Tax=Xanthomonas cucurbitae TaxID=56453 RepID=A0ABY7YD84_9XANT|nr:hypothetical protein [Xanthomonas cucurbitae]WDM67979.1 hypothetical protein K6981_01155 [Xanthomonas cucurbitae]WDM71853.1 hypothetical protein K6978_01150 [Xanthomonas cucurbitae]WDM75210.1 hypothetical protein K6982_18040 [Xanthomonas cucurbitae]
MFNDPAYRQALIRRVLCRIAMQARRSIVRHTEGCLQCALTLFNRFP